MKELGLPAVLPSFLREAEAGCEFVWRSPRRDAAPCTPESCPYATADNGGLVVVLGPAERLEPVCLNAGCGGEGQEALVDWEAEERRREAEQRRGAVEQLRRITLEQTLLAPHGEAIELCAPDMLEMRESAVGLAEKVQAGTQQVSWYDEREAHIYFTDGGRRRILAPDGRVHLGEMMYLVEMDRATESTTKIADKLRQYYRFHRGGVYRRYGTGFQVLVVVPAQDGERERIWLDYAAREAVRCKAEPLPVLATTLDRLRSKGVGGAIWRGVGNRKQLVRLSEGAR
jgi:hypothetical protein